MFETGPKALVKGGFALPDANVYPLKCEFTPQKAAVPVTDWLTAHPDVKNILMHTIDDERMLGMLNAMKQAGRSGDADRHRVRRRPARPGADQDRRPAGVDRATSPSSTASG